MQIHPDLTHSSSGDLYRPAADSKSSHKDG